MSDRKLNRRGLLKTGLLGGAGLSIFGGSQTISNLAQAAPGGGPDIYYIFAYFSGGWDILLGLDPRDPTVFTEEVVRDTLIQPGYEQLQAPDAQLVRAGNFTFGPFIGDLANHADKLAVIRGMSMETLTHEAGRRRFITGKAPSGLQARGSAATTWLASVMGADHPIPNLSMQVESFNVDRPAFASALKANGVSDLVRALRPQDPSLGSFEQRALDQLLADAAKCGAAKKSKVWQAAEVSRAKARQMVASQLDSRFDFGANNTQMEQIRSHYGFARNGSGLSSSAAKAAMAAQAIKGGVSRCVSFQVAGGLDTHFQNWSSDQGPLQEGGFNLIARLVEDLQNSQYKNTSESWLDHTVIVGFSEFSRTARLNQRGGRDHALTNAAFALGAGIKGGTLIGASSNIGMEPQTIDMATGRVDQGGEIPKPEHLIQALMDTAGIKDDPADLRVGPLKAIQKPIRG